MTRSRFSRGEWELAGGWSLVAQQIDVEGNKVWVELKKNGETIDSDVISVGENLARPQKTYLYKDSDDYPVFYCYVDSIFRGSTSDFVVFKYAFLRGDIISIENGDTYGAFDVTGFEVPVLLNDTDYAGSGSGTVLNTGDAALVMSIDDDITLDPDEVIDLYGGMYLKTEDTTSPCLKMTLWKKYTIVVPESIVEEKVVEEGTLEDKNAEVVVVDMAEKDETSTLSSAPETSITSMSSENESEQTKGGSISLPGFEILPGIMGVLGILGALRLQKQK